MTFNPVDLVFLGSSGNYLKHVSSNGSVHTYQKYFPDGTADDPENKVTYNSSDRKWRDTGTDHPYGFKINTSSTTTAPYNTGYDTVSVATLQNNTQYVHMNTSTQGGPWATVQMDGWSATGGGTGTEGSSYSGTLTVNGNDLEWVIPASSSSGSYYLLSGVNNTFSLELTITVGSSGATGSAPNFDQTKIWILRSPTEDELYRISPKTQKKVHSNFW